MASSSSRGFRPQGGSRRADTKPTTPLDWMDGHANMKPATHGHDDSHLGYPKRSRSAIGHQTSYLDVPTNSGSGRLSQEGTRDTLKSHPRSRSRSRSPIPSAALADQRPDATPRNAELPGAPVGQSKRFLASSARVERHGQLFDSSDSDSSLSYPSEFRDRLSNFGHNNLPSEWPGKRIERDTSKKPFDQTEPDTKLRVSPLLSNRVSTKLPRLTKTRNSPDVPSQPRGGISPSAEASLGFTRRPDVPVLHHQSFPSKSPGAPHAAMMVPNPYVSGTTKEWSRYEAVHGSGGLDIGSYSAAPSEPNSRNTLDFDDPDFEDSDIPYHKHHAENLHPAEVGRRENKSLRTERSRNRVLEAPIKRRSPSPPPIPVPPPSPADARKPSRQHSSTHLKAPKEHSVPDTRPRSKSTSESVQPLGRPSAKLRSTENLGLGDPPPRSAIVSKSPAKPPPHDSLLTERKYTSSHHATRHIPLFEQASHSVTKSASASTRSRKVEVSNEPSTRVPKHHDTTFSRGLTKRTPLSTTAELLDPLPSHQSHADNQRSPAPRYSPLPVPNTPLSTSFKDNSLAPPPNGRLDPSSPRRRGLTPASSPKPDHARQLNASPYPNEPRDDLARLVRRSALARPLAQKEEHVSHEPPPESNAFNRLSMLRRITASPYPADVDDAQSSSRSDEESDPTVQPMAQTPHNPLYMALGDALAKPYSHQGISQPPYAMHSGHFDSKTPGQYSESAHEQRFDTPHNARPSSPVISAPRSHDRQGTYPTAPAYFPEKRLDRDFPSMGSDLSSILSEEHRLSEGDTSISGAAEELFKSLSGAGGLRASTAADVHDLSGSPSDSRHTGSTESPAQRLHHPTEALWDNTGLMPPTWRETLTEDAYQALLAHYDIFEMRRQEVIWELCRSEEQFVELLQTTLTLFVQPLRTENDTRWIPGLDAGVAKLFDWLDDVAQLHADVLAIMQGCRTNQLPIVAQIGESLRPFVSRLELYQPYVVRVDEVSDSIRSMIRDPQSDFGEFVRIQTASPECPTPLLELLQKPIERLLKYPVYFKQLFGLTPRSHEDHLGMFSLLHGTDMMIRVLQTVKSRENEYATVKVLASRIQGMPATFQLASRERRLIGQGPLLRVHFDQPPDDWGHMPEIDYCPTGSAPSFDGRFPQPFRSREHSAVSSNPSSRPFIFHTRPGFEDEATTSEAPSSTMESPSDPLSYDLHMRSDSVASTVLGDPRRGAFPHSNIPSKTPPEWIYAFVFTDIVVLARHSQSVNIRGVASDSWELLPDVGIARVLGYSDVSGGKYEHLIGLELLPFEPNRAFPSQPPSIPVFLSLAERITGRMSLAPTNVLQDARKQWSSAFSRCYVYTMRSLAFPASYNSRIMKAGSNGHKGASAPVSIMSVLSSDRPLPKSPSVQLLDHSLESVEQERQERDWWASRFQQVLEELSSGAEVEHMTAGPTEKTRVRQPTPWEAEPDGKTFSSRPISIIKDSKSKFFKLK